MALRGKAPVPCLEENMHFEAPPNASKRISVIVVFRTI